jgi:UDP-N-acetylmuramate--alanine ligase
MQSFTNVHLIGIGGIHVSAVARLLKARGVRVSGSDSVESDEITRLRAQGIVVTVGHDAANVPPDAEAVVYSDAVPETNPERIEALARKLPLFDSHQFLGQLFLDATQIVITGTHGKSTTTAMVGKILEAVGEDPTVVVGTRVPGWEYGNLRIGRDNLLVVEGDEYRSHVLSYRPTVLGITNIEWDHPDIFKTAEAYHDLFRRAETSVVKGGSVVHGGEALDIALKIPGVHNRQNAALARAAVLAYRSAIAPDVITTALTDFPGVWRRFESVGTLNDAPVISDYGHHPTEVRETLKAAREAFPNRRIVLCYQPHQRARTKQLFADFIPVLAEADVLVLAEIYDVPGREEKEYADVSSQKLIEALPPSDRVRSYAVDIADAERQIRDLAQPNDLILVMGAGTIDKVARNLVV